jgi:serine/threonine protein kinase
VIGQQLGHFRILDKLGAGGMGEVYRARDTKLNRDVAVKVLPNHLIGDPERALRFEREAQALAALNHPNIAQIYGTEQHALVMEYVPGDDLAVVLRRGPIDVADALPIARQIVLALEAAHAASITHRDLKPANIKLDAAGTVKVLDFGLARITGPDSPVSGSNAQNSPTMTSPGTAMGVILGTAGYMSPEQARGRFVDKRADIWAFGCVLYEMLTGRRAFEGETVTDILSAVISQEPDWKALPAGTPSSIRRLLVRCLQKDPKNRLHDIADARLEIDAASSDSAAPETALAAPQRPAGRTALITLLLVAAALAAGMLIGNPWRPAPPPETEWVGSRLGGPTAYDPHLSPDGHLLAFAAMVDGQSQMAVMKPGTGNWQVITHDRAHGFINSANWSRDGSQIYFDRQSDAVNGIYSVPTFGGEERLLRANAGSPLPLRDGTLLFGALNADRIWQLHRLWPDTGREEPLPFVKIGNSRVQYLNLMAQIDDERVAIVGQPLGSAPGSFGLYVFNLKSGQSTLLTSASDTVPDAVAVDPTDHSVLMAARETALHRIRRYRIGASGPAPVVMDFTSTPYFTAGPDGSLFVTLEDRHFSVLRFAETGSPVETVTASATHFGPATALDDGRTLMSSRVTDQTHLFVVAPGKEPLRLAQTDEPTFAPATSIAGGRAALLVGRDRPEIAIISVSTGALLHRIPAPLGITTLGASPDGKTLYFAADGHVSAVAIDEGGASSAPRVVGPGDSVVVDPDTGDLIVKSDAADAFTLTRFAKAAGPPQLITIGDTNLRLASQPLSAGSIRKGRLVLPVGTVDSWYWLPAILDLKTGHIERVRVAQITDFHYTTWSADGRILGTALGMESSLWKFEKAVSGR